MFWIRRLASPQSWPDTAQTFAAAMSGDASAVLDAVNEKELVVKGGAVMMIEVTFSANVVVVALVMEIGVAETINVLV